MTKLRKTVYIEKPVFDRSFEKVVEKKLAGENSNFSTYVELALKEALKKKEQKK